MDDAAVLLYLRYNPRRLIGRAESLDHRDAYSVNGLPAGWRVKTFDAGGRVKMDPHDVAEKDELLDLYREAIGMPVG